MKEWLERWGAILAIVVALTACGTEPEPDTLTMEEATAMLKGSWATWLAFNPPFGESSFSCPGGGEVYFTVTPSPIQSIVDPRGCRFTGSGLTFTVDGDPSVAMNVEFGIVDGRPQRDGNIEGAVAWKLADRSGSCRIDLTIVDYLATQHEPRQTTFSGMLCGHEVTEWA